MCHTAPGDRVCNIPVRKYLHQRILRCVPFCCFPFTIPEHLVLSQAESTPGRRRLCGLKRSMPLWRRQQHLAGQGRSAWRLRYTFSHQPYLKFCKNTEYSAFFALVGCTQKLSSVLSLAVDFRDARVRRHRQTKEESSQGAGSLVLCESTQQHRPFLNVCCSSRPKRKAHADSF